MRRHRSWREETGQCAHSDLMTLTELTDGRQNWPRCSREAEPLTGGQYVRTESGPVRAQFESSGVSQSVAVISEALWVPGRSAETRPPDASLRRRR